VALVHLDTAGQSERVVDAIRATAADTEGDIADMTADEVMTRRALDLLGSKRNDAYEARWRRDCLLPTNGKATLDSPREVSLASLLRHEVSIISGLDWGNCYTFFLSDWAIREFGRYFEVLAIRPRAEDYQTALTLRKR
jgi:hypothetical protein